LFVNILFVLISTVGHIGKETVCAGDLAGVGVTQSSQVSKSRKGKPENLSREAWKPALYCLQSALGDVTKEFNICQLDLSLRKPTNLGNSMSTRKSESNQYASQAEVEELREKSLA
jgi:hypothetical protein